MKKPTLYLGKKLMLETCGLSESRKKIIAKEAN
jgi:hypothetical protein